MAFINIKGEERAKKILLGSFNNKRVPNAFLFSGQNLDEMRQISVDYAQMLNCSAADFMDLVPLEKRQTIGIDQVKELQDLIKYGPSIGKHLVVLICECEKLTLEAANCLLKTLEEPPKDVLFILTTCREDYLPRTVISRCQKIIFTNSQEEEIEGKVTLPARQMAALLAFSKELAADKETLLQKLYSLALGLFSSKKYADSKIVLETVKDIKRKANKKIALDYMALRLAGSL
jgi:DNA polymerase III delta prime subunit